ncbi:MAG: glycosyl hydrolase [Gammaproteobacteria bacterium]|nr:glycosyl hydrolase [Gammaproteobacteria bacterium]
MKISQSIAMFGLITALLVASTVDARSRPDGAADYADKQAAWQRHQDLASNSPYKGLEWRNVGPVVQGGRLVDLEVVPGQPYTFYAAYASGGLWKTTNNGHTFESLFDDQATMIMGDIAVDPNNSETVWVGTGENNSSRSSYGGMGIFRSDDGGQSWRHMGLGDTDRIGRILIDPNDSDTIYVAALGKLYTPGGQRGIFRSTDGGKNWKQVLEGGDWTGIIDLVFKPDDAQTLYAASWDRKRRPWDFTEAGTGSAIYKSTDGGNSWSHLEGGLPGNEFVGRIGLAVSAANPEMLYASIDNQQPLAENQWNLGDRPINAKRLRNMSKEQFLAQDKNEIERFIRSSDFDVSIDADKLTEWVRNGKVSIKDIIDQLGDANANLFNTDIIGLQVWRSDDAGANWSLTHDKPLDQVVYSYGYYFGEIRVSPKDPDQIYVLGVPVVKSNDGGKTWFSVQGRGVHGDHQSMWINPRQPDHLIIGNDGGADVSYDGGETWVKMDAQPLGQFYTVNVDMAEPYNVYGGLQDNGTIRCSSTNRWQTGANCKRINGGDGMYVAVDPRDNKTTYSGSQFGYYARLGDGPRAEVRPRNAFGDPAVRYNWNTPVILSPHSADVVYFGANRLYRSMDQGDTWTAISDDLSRSKNRGDVPYGTMTSLSESPLQFGLIWAGTDDGQVWVTDSSGTRWKDVAGKLPKDRWVSRVEASNHARNRAYVTLNGYRDDDIRAYVYRTDDLGKRFKDISRGLPAEAINVIREDPLVEDILYVGTDSGVYVSTDRGDSWSALQGGLPNVPVHDLVVHPRERELVAGTHGRSIWIVDVLPLQDLVEAGSDTALKVFYVDDVKASRGWRSERSRWYFDPDEAPESTVKYWSLESGPVSIEILDSSDAVVRRLSGEAVQGMNSLEWDLLVDKELALAAETSAQELEKESNSGADDEKSLSLADTPYAESVRLGHSLYAIPGDYTIRVSVGAHSDSTDLKIKAPKDYEPRSKEPYKVRGRK